jgi:putative transcriptional regulator
MENYDDILKVKTNNVKPGRGRILISEPFLYDYYFRRSVVLLAEHNKEGSFGVIINKPMEVNFEEVVKDFPDFESKVYLGGPVKTDSLFFIHTLGDEIENSLPILRGLFWGGDLERVKELIMLNQLNDSNIRFFIGYSGWMPKQLDNELKRDSWLVSSMSAEEIMQGNPDKMWKKSVLEIGGRYKIWTNFPAEPTLN